MARLSTSRSPPDGGSIPQRKILVVGDGAVGKTSMLTVYVRGEFPQAYEPTVFENFVKEVEVEMEGRRQIVRLALWDTAGQEDFSRLRTLSYPDTHCVLLCFSVDLPTSLENVDKWIEEIAHYCPDVRICLVALKCDLRTNNAVVQRLAQTAESPISYQEGLEVAKRIRASRYLELSAKENRGVKETMAEAAKVALSANKRSEVEEEQGRCCLLS